MKLSFLGCGDAFQYELGNNCAFFTKGDDLFFLDMGQGMFQKAMHLGLLEGRRSVTIFITHMHLDHIGSINEAIVYLTILNPIKDFTIVYEDSDKLVEFLKDITPFDDVKFIKESEGLIHGVSFRSVNAKHTGNAHSYFLKDEESYIYYSGDSKELNLEALELLNKGELDLLYQDTATRSSAFHLGLKSLSEQIKPELRNKVVTIHLTNKELSDEAKAEGFLSALDSKLN